MLHRTKKANDENEGKWIGVGGKCEEGKAPKTHGTACWRGAEGKRA
jgi:hypothetical protein